LFPPLARRRQKHIMAGMSEITFHPVIQRWFAERFGEPTEPQRLGWPHIAAGRHTLIAAPTGSGKTLAAFLVCLDSLWREALAGSLDDSTRVVYISPLKALSNDIERNLQGPLAEITELANSLGVEPPRIRTAVRTGDTPAAQRQSMLRRPPHILVTTPESLFILLTSSKSRERLRSVRTIIVDEIHALARDKRGSHLSLTLERLAHGCERRGQAALRRQELRQAAVWKRILPAMSPSSTPGTCGNWISRSRRRPVNSRPSAATSSGARSTSGSVL
jgi:ATP-dependent Lhr-like helicase